MLPVTALVSALVLLSTQVHGHGLESRLVKRASHQRVARATTDRSASALRKAKGTVPLGGFEYVGESGVSVQMMAMGTKTTAIFLDSEFLGKYARRLS